MSLADTKRAQIIAAAAAEFQTRGFAGASMDRIAAAAKVSKRTVYNHFEGKEALFHAILAVVAECGTSSGPAPYDPARPVADQLLEIGHAKGRLLRKPDFMRLARMMSAEILRDGDLTAELSARVEDYSGYIAFFAAATEAGALTCPDPRRAAAEFLGMIKGQAFWPVMFTGQVLEEDEMDRIIASAVRAIMGAYGA